MSKYFTGLGERNNIPPQMPTILANVAKGLTDDGWQLRTNGDNGVAAMMQSGVSNKGELYLPWQGYNSKISRINNINSECIRSVAYSYVHKYGFMRLSEQKVVLANIASLLGEDGKQHSEFCVTYMYERHEQEYTLLIAKAHDIPIYSLVDMNPHSLISLVGGEDV